MPSNEPPNALRLPQKSGRRGAILSSLVGLLFLTAFVPLVLTSRYLVNQARADLELDQRSLQMAKVRHLSEWIAQFRRSSHDMLQTLAVSLAIDAPADYKKRIDGLASRRTLEAFPGESSPLVSVAVVDRSGFGARAGLALSEPPINDAVQQAFLAGLEGKSTSTAPIWSTSISEPVIISAEPVPGPNKSARAVVIAITSLEGIVIVTRESGEGGILDVFVVTGEGNLVAHSDRRVASTGADVKGTDIVQEFMHGPGRAAASMPFTLKDAKGATRHMLGTFIRVADDSGWGVIAQIDEAKAYAGANAMWRNSMLVVGVVSVLALGLGLLLSRQITKPIRTLRDAALQLANGDFRTRVTLKARNEVGLLGDAFNVMAEHIERAVEEIRVAAVERERLNEQIVLEARKRERLCRFLSPQVANRIMATSHSQGFELSEPEVREVSILFADIVGFTSMSERLTPSEVAVMLNEYLSEMTDAIFKFEGTLDKYIGDAIMAVFGAPLDMPDHATRAVKAAIEMRTRLAEFNASRSDGSRLQIRIGINSGRAVAGEIGSINKREYTVLGDAVNTASRLESSVAKPGLIVIGPKTYDAVHPQQEFAFRQMGEFALKGKETRVIVHEVLGTAA